MTENRPKTQRGATVYIRRIKSKGYEYLYLMEDVLIDGKKVAKTVANFGRADRLTDEQQRKVHRAQPKTLAIRSIQTEDALNRLLPLMTSDRLKLPQPRELCQCSLDINHKKLRNAHSKQFVKHGV